MLIVANTESTEVLSLNWLPAAMNRNTQSSPDITNNIVKRRQHFEHIFNSGVHLLTENYHLNWYKLLGLPPELLQLDQQNFLQLASKIQRTQEPEAKHRTGEQQTRYRNKWLIQVTACGSNTRTADICTGLAKAPHLHERKINTSFESEGLAPKLRLSEVDQLKSRQKNLRILVDASNGDLTKHFKAHNRPGVLDIVAGTSHVKQCLIQYQDGISFLPIGSNSKDSDRQPMTEFGARKLCKQLTLLNHSVIIHSPDMTKDPDTVRALAASARCTLGVMRFDTPFDTVKQYHEKLNQHNTHGEVLLVGSRMPLKMRDPELIWPYLFPGVLEQTTPL